MDRRTRAYRNTVRPPVNPGYGSKRVHVRLTDKPFLAIDGEAYTLSDTNNQCYFLLAASDGRYIQDTAGLTTRQCFSFLLGLGVKELWTFGAGYDVNHWLRDWSEPHLRRLAETGRAYWSEYSVEHIPGKYFYLAERSQDIPPGLVKRRVLRSVRVWDMWSYAGSSFARWCEDWHLASAAETEHLLDMKAQRGGFRLDQADAIRHYCALELELLARGVGKLKRLCDDIGLRPRSWYSPGSLAAVAMTARRVDEYKNSQPEQSAELTKAIESAYYGGRFENACVGAIPGPLYSYDIRSAYPAAAVDLPSLAGAEWEHVTDTKGLRSPRLLAPSTIALLRVAWQPRDTAQTWGGFPRPSYGFLHWPLTDKVGRLYSQAHDKAAWYWSAEVRAAQALHYVKVLEAWVLHVADHHRPLAFLADLYADRQRYKALGDERQHVLKLIINSAYGKLAQRPRGDGVPRFRELVWAGLITAKVRARLVDAIAQHPLVDNPVVSLATDGLISKAPCDLDVGPNLGQWETRTYEQLMLVQTGIYYDDTGKVRTRGIGRASGSDLPDAVARHWYQGEPLQVPDTRFIGYRLALARNDLGQWRQWRTEPRRLLMSPAPKRVETERVGDILYSKPYMSLDNDCLQRDAWDRLLMNMETPGVWELAVDADQPDGVE